MCIVHIDMEPSRQPALRKGWGPPGSPSHPVSLSRGPFGSIWRGWRGRYDESVDRAQNLNFGRRLGRLGAGDPFGGRPGATAALRSLERALDLPAPPGPDGGTLRRAGPPLRRG